MHPTYQPAMCLLIQIQWLQGKEHHVLQSTTPWKIQKVKRGLCVNGPDSTNSPPMSPEYPLVLLLSIFSFPFIFFNNY